MTATVPAPPPTKAVEQRRLARLANPPGWWLNGTVIVAGLGLLAAASTPGWNYWLALGAFLLAVATVPIWIVRALAYGNAWRQGELRPHGLRFLVAPAIGLAVVILIALGVPMRARWATSEHAFDQAAADATVKGDSYHPPSRIGTYEVIVVRVEADAVFFNTTGGLMDDVGFAYMPNGPDPKIPNGEHPQYEHLHGPWYTWSAGW